MFYTEEANVHGKWTPVKIPEKPIVKNGRIDRNDSIGPRIRRMGESYSKPISEEHSELTLGELWKIYSPDADQRGWRSTKTDLPDWGEDVEHLELKDVDGNIIAVSGGFFDPDQELPSVQGLVTANSRPVSIHNYEWWRNV